MTITIDYPYSQIIPDELEYLKFLVHKVSNNFLEIDNTTSFNGI